MCDAILSRTESFCGCKTVAASMTIESLLSKSCAMLGTTKRKLNRVVSQYDSI